MASMGTSEGDPGRDGVVTAPISSIVSRGSGKAPAKTSKMNSLPGV